MRCHYCGYSEPYKGSCKKCNGSLMSLGAGTQKIEEEAAALFPNARIARLDSDTAQNKTYESKTIKGFANGEIDILIGTQIVTKGFDFSNLSLVAVIAADGLLGMQDFRADEKALQLLEQFRGRCGRRERKGLFVIQTSQPEHPVYQKIANNEASTLNMTLMQERKDFNFPPFSRIVELTIKDTFEDRAERMAMRLGNIMRKHFEPAGTPMLGGPVTGPYAPVVDRIADQHIRTIRISLRKDRNLAKGKETIRTAIREFEKSQKYDGHITINVDPS
jgi:primosomal protein N' (replication factor Y)